MASKLARDVTLGLLQTKKKEDRSSTPEALPISTAKSYTAHRFYYPALCLRPGGEGRWDTTPLSETMPRDANNDMLGRL